MADHTPLPWEAGETGHGSPYAVYSDDATGSIIAMCQHTYVNRSHEQMIANVAFIVKAVNNHDALVKALHEATTRLADVVATGQAADPSARRPPGGRTMSEHNLLPDWNDLPDECRSALRKAAGWFVRDGEDGQCALDMYNELRKAMPPQPFPLFNAPAPQALSQWTDRDMLIGGTRYKAGSITIADVLDHAARASNEFYADDDELSEEDRHMVDWAWEKHKSAAPKFLATEDGEFNGNVVPERETVTIFVPDGYSSAAEFVKDCGFEPATTPPQSAATSDTPPIAELLRNYPDFRMVPTRVLQATYDLLISGMQVGDDDKKAVISARRELLNLINERPAAARNDRGSPA